MGKTVFLSGVNGYIGSNFMRQYDRVLNIIPIARKAARSGAQGIRTALAYEDLATVSIDRDITEKATLVHLIGSARETRLNAIYDANVRSTEYLIAFCKRVGIDQIIYLSGYGVSSSSWSVYYRAKAQGEAIIEQSGLNYAILRCSYIIGGNDELTPFITNMATTGIVSIPGDGRYRIQPVYLDDVLRLIYHFITSDDVLNITIDVLGETISYKDLVSDLAKRVNPDAKIIEEDLAELIREALFSEAPRYSLCEIGILVADKVGEPSGHVLGIRMRTWRELLAAIS